MLELVRDISHGKGIQVIVSTHILPDIERVCDSVVVMRLGKLAMQGTIADLRATDGRQYDIDLRFPTAAFLNAVIGGGGVVVHELGALCRIQLDGTGVDDPGRFIFEAARESGAEVRGFRPAVRSLEDVFLEAVE
jgi:ABC-2 type transport system ATP-binding protein